MKKLFLFIVPFMGCLTLQGQQIGDGKAVIISNFNVPIKTGIYTTGSSQAGYPGTYLYNYLFAMRSDDSNSNNQFQIASDFTENDRVFFRKIMAGADLSGRNTPWVEFATRGANTFNGWQNINGSVLLPINNGFYIGSTGNTGNRMRLDLNDYAVTFDYYPALYIRTGTGGPASTVMTLTNNGNVGIGTANPQNKLEVNGTVRAKEIKVESTGWPDYVFDSSYNLPSLKEVETHIQEHKHLPGIPSQAQVEENGVDLGAMNALLLRKVEELTLYILQQEERIKALEAK